jgi:acyl CoA:acetate/3-ketoacid CoA transferase alpha subunit
VTPLPEAIRTHVVPGLHLHFASTPSRSNAAIRELARAFAGRAPGFCLSSTGFHSMAHLLPMLGLTNRLIGCFFGDHYPEPRPNSLYQRIAAAGVTVEHWSLWSLVASLRAGAEGNDWVVNRSLRGTTMAAELAARGAYRELAVPGDPANAPHAPHAPHATAPGGAPATHTIGLCAALRPDVTFVHAAAADAEGHVIMPGPLAEGLWSAHAARRGVIVTVERIVPTALTRAHPEAIALAPHRILAICEEPFGAHPQPFHCAPELAIPTYRDDFDHYERWRTLTHDRDAFDAFVDRVLSAPDGRAAYRGYVGATRLAQLTQLTPPRAPRAAPPATATSSPAPAPPASSAVDQLIITGARQLVQRVQAQGARVLIAGIGQAFFAARVAQLQLAAAGYTLRVMVETGLYDVDCGAHGHGYLLSYENTTRARRLTGVDDILGVLTCGADNHCIAALGAAQIDRHGNLNSTRLGGKALVGAGGACDIAASAQEVVVMTRLGPGRLVDEVEYITSPGHAVRSVVTDRGVLARTDTHADGSWTIASLTATCPEQTLEAGVAALARDCAWRLAPAGDLAFAAAITGEEARLLEVLDPTGKYRRRTS